MTPAPGRRRAFSLNGLVIQVSAFALSFTLVALLVVGSSRAAFVEQNETVLDRVAAEQPEPPPPAFLPTAPPAAGRPVRTPAPEPVPEDAPEVEVPAAEEPAEEAAEEPAEEVSLFDDAAGTAMFTDDSGLAPGSPSQQCIRVTFDGSVDPRPVLLYAASVQGALARYLDLTVEMGPADGGAFGDCSAFVPAREVFSGTLADFGAEHGGFGTGLTTWDPAGQGDARSFRFTVEVRDDPLAEGLSAGFGFTWEARS